MTVADFTQPATDWTEKARHPNSDLMQGMLTKTAGILRHSAALRTGRGRDRQELEARRHRESELS
jgi:hypothetical protein